MSTRKNEGLLVRRIREGIVIDHIPAGRALYVLKLLGITGREGYRIALVMNVESRKLGKKDIVKIEGRFLKPEEYNKIALIAPTATVNIIKDYHVVKKDKVVLPEVIEGIIVCPNPTCISRKPSEPIASKFKRLSDKPLKLQCMYCGAIVEEEDILKSIVEGSL